MKTDGSVACWGNNSSGEATPPGTTSSRTYSQGSYITFPSEPDAYNGTLINASFHKDSQGYLFLSMENRGYATYGQVTYTCKASGGCQIAKEGQFVAQVSLGTIEVITRG